MSGVLLERARSLLETTEGTDRALVAALNEKPNGQKAKVLQQHNLCRLIDASSKDHKELIDLLKDDGALRSEISQMKGPDMFHSFYSAVATTREYYARFPSLHTTSDAVSVADVGDSVPFSGEEVFGKYLDLHSFHLRYTNLPGVPAREQDYLQYLDKFNTFFYITESSKNSKHYRTYISDLWAYLSDFFSRVQPLVDKATLISAWRSDFDLKWEAGDIPGWKKKTDTSAQALRLGIFNSVEELEALGLDRLKEALEALGLKCGGTLKDRASRLWAVRGKKAEDIPQKFKAPCKGGGGKSNNVLLDNRVEVAWTEFCVQRMCETMTDVVSATRKHAEKQQSRTVEEKEAEIWEEEYGHVVEEDVAEDGAGNADEPFYNPLNLPLGWDGKPIPFWLYKLHGLGVEYRCEVCGNQSYWGRRAFDKHFQEWRHAHGMRCLGVPNTKHFHDITLIEDVVALYNKIKGNIQSDQELVADEEFEDTEGNVLNRRTYEDLARQGLL